MLWFEVTDSINQPCCSSAAQHGKDYLLSLRFKKHASQYGPRLFLCHPTSDKLGYGVKP